MIACKVLSHLGDGLYSVEVYHSNEAITTRIDAIASKLEDLAPVIAKQLAMVQQVWLDVEWYINNNNLLIIEMNATEPDSNEKQALINSIRENTIFGLKARRLYDYENKTYQILMAEEASLNVENTMLLGKVVNNAIMDVWCVDLADGIGGRAVYAVNEESALWCLNYDAGTEEEAKYLLPPKNLDVSWMNSGNFNIPYAFPEPASYCMSFWNVAMESGFGVWEPILVMGVVNLEARIKDTRDCTDTNDGHVPETKRIPVTIPSIDLRFGGVSLSIKEVICDVTYFDDYKSFVNDDEVAVRVIIDETGITGGIILGYIDHPKIFREDISDNGSCEADKDTLKLVLEAPIGPDIDYKIGVPGNASTAVPSNTHSFYTSAWANSEQLTTESGGVEYPSYRGQVTSLDATTPYLIGGCEFSCIINSSAHSVSYTATREDGLYSIYSHSGNQIYMEIAGVMIPWNYFKRHFDMEIGNYHEEKVFLSELTSICLSTGGYSGIRVEQTIDGTFINGGSTTTLDMVQRVITIEVDCNGVMEETNEVITNTSVQRSALYSANSTYKEQSYDVVDDTSINVYPVIPFLRMEEPPVFVGNSTC